jgi:hypothetical protein
MSAYMWVCVCIIVIVCGCVCVIVTVIVWVCQCVCEIVIVWVRLWACDCVCVIVWVRTLQFLDDVQSSCAQFRSLCVDGRGRLHYGLQCTRLIHPQLVQLTAHSGHLTHTRTMPHTGTHAHRQTTHTQTTST